MVGEPLHSRQTFRFQGILKFDPTLYQVCFGFQVSIAIDTTPVDVSACNHRCIFFCRGGGGVPYLAAALLGALSIEHSSGGPLWTRAHSHTHARTFAHFRAYSDLLSCPHGRLVPMLCHKSELSHRFYSFEWKEARQPPNNLEKTQESKSIVLLLLKLVPGLTKEWGDIFYLF